MSNRWCLWRAAQLRQIGNPESAAEWERRSDSEPAPNPDFRWPNGFNRASAVAHVQSNAHPDMPDDASDFWVLGALNQLLNTRRVDAGHPIGGGGHPLGGGGGGSGLPYDPYRNHGKFAPGPKKERPHAQASEAAHAASAHAEKAGTHEAHQAAQKAHYNASIAAAAAGDKAGNKMHRSMEDYHKEAAAEAGGSHTSAAHPEPSAHAPYGYSTGPGRIVAYKAPPPEPAALMEQSGKAMQLSKAAEASGGDRNGIKGTAAAHEAAMFAHNDARWEMERTGNTEAARQHAELNRAHSDKSNYIKLHDAAAAATAHANAVGTSDAHFAAASAHRAILDTVSSVHNRSNPAYHAAHDAHAAAASKHSDMAHSLREPIPSTGYRGQARAGQDHTTATKSAASAATDVAYKSNSAADHAAAAQAHNTAAVTARAAGKTADAAHHESMSKGHTEAAKTSQRVASTSAQIKEPREPTPRAKAKAERENTIMSAREAANRGEHATAKKLFESVGHSYHHPSLN